MSKGCFIEYNGKTKGFGTKSQVELETRIQKIRDDLAKEGKSFTTTEEGQLAVFKRLQEQTAKKQKQATDKMMQRLSTNEALNERFDELARTTQDLDRNDPKYRQKLMSRFVSMVFTTNDTKTLPFEQMKKTRFKNTFGDFLARTRKLLDDDDPIDYLNKPENYAKVMTEYNQFFKNPNAVDSITKDVKAFKVAKELFDTQFKMAEMRRANGVNTLMQDLRLRPKWSHQKIKRANKDDFIRKIANALDPEVHGDLARRQQLADELHQNMSNPNGKWREQGDTNYQNIKADEQWIEEVKGAFAFKDGAELADITKEFSDVDLRRQMLLQFEEMSREDALVQFLGADYKRGLIELEQELAKEGRFTSDTKAAFSYLKNFADPENLEHSRSAAILTGARGYMASTKLGSATITALMDIPAMMFSGKHLFGLPTHKLLGSIFQYGYKGAPQEYTRYAQYMLEGVDSYLNHMNNRFGMIGNGVSGQVEEGGAKLANAVFKYSGLNFWTEGRKAMALGIYGKELGNLLSKKTEWDNLGPKFRQQLEKFGVRKKDWNLLKKKQPLDKNGRVDIFQIDEMDYEYSYGKASLRQKVSAAFNDAVDTMVMTPGDYDIAAGAFFNDPATVGTQIFKTLTQFKAHPISYTRKILVRSFKNNSRLEFATNMTILGTEMMLMGVAVVQLKEFLKGNQPRKMDDANLYIRAAEQSGAFGLFSDLSLEFFGSQFASSFTDEPQGFFASQQKSSALLGPLVSDIIGLTDDLANIGSMDDDSWMEKLPDASKMLINTIPGQNLWYLTLLKRVLIHDYIKARTDPAGYRRSQKKLKKLAKDNRIGGEANNFLKRMLVD
tara:strand:+ start:10097 stop:12613 length:2517 start_codon:yes stop_codon:yes gene_type:complete